MHPLLENYEKYYGKKEEEPKKEEVKGITNISLSKEHWEELAPYLTTSGTSGISSGLTRSNFITTSNSTVSISTPNIRTFSSYDLNSINDSFLQVADKIKMNKAQVTNMEVSFDKNFGYNLSTKTLTFSVEVYDTP